MEFRNYLNSTILAHVAGAAGSGKSTLMSKIKSAFPQILVVDLDKFDDLGTRKINMSWNWKNTSYSDELLNKSHVFRQSALNKLIKNAEKLGKKLVIFGIHKEGDTEYQFDTPNRILLMRPINDIVRDRLKRDIEFYKKHNIEIDVPSLEKQYKQETIEEIDNLLSAGYKPMSPGQVFNFIKKLVTNSEKQFES